MKLSDTKFKEIFPFNNPRAGQKELIEKIISAYESGKKYVILNAPTGTGKSVIGYTIAKYFESAYVLTSQKVLQEQYYNDLSIPLVLGRNNYTCQKNSALTCEMGECFRNFKKMCKKTVNGKSVIACPYLVARDNCLMSPFSNLNYSYFLAMTELEMLSKKNLIIADECHNLENELIKKCTIKIDDALLKYINKKLTLPIPSATSAAKCKWLIVDLNEEIRSEFLYLKGKLNKLKDLKSTREYKKIATKHSVFEKLIISINSIKLQLEKNEKIIVTQDKDFIEFKMLHGKNIFKETLEKFSDRFLFMSASILNYKCFINDLGLNPLDVEYIECDSQFPVENRLIHYTPVGSMSFRSKNETMPKLIKKIDQLLKVNKNVKGIIHTGNYDIAEKIIQGLSFSDQSSRLLMPRGKERQTILDIFYTSSKPYVLISPSLTEGIDLKEDLSRLCIICKVPYANLMDKWTKTRMSESQEWYINLACMTLVQMTGRSIRSETDFATTYILDSDFLNLAKNSTKIFPKWWQESVVTY